MTTHFIIHVKYFLVVLFMLSDDSQYWPKHAKANFYVLILNLLHLMDLPITNALRIVTILDVSCEDISETFELFAV